MMINVLITIFFTTIFIDLGESKSIDTQSMNTTIEKYCSDQTNIAEEEIKSIENLEIQPTEEYYCYLLCILTTAGIIGEDGTLDVDKFVVDVYDQVDKDCLKNLGKLTECSDLEEMEKCDLTPTAKP